MKSKLKTFPILQVWKEPTDGWKELYKDWFTTAQKKVTEQSWLLAVFGI